MEFTIDDIQKKFTLSTKIMKMGPPVYEFMPNERGTGYVLNTEAVESKDQAWKMVLRNENLLAKKRQLAGVSGIQTAKVHTS